MSPSGGEKKTIFAIVWTSAFNGVANWQQSDKVEYDAQLQTFPYPPVSKSFLYSNAFVAKSGAQSLTFYSVTDRQTKKLTPPSPTKLSMVIEDLEHVLAPRKLFGV